MGLNEGGVREGFRGGVAWRSGDGHLRFYTVVAPNKSMKMCSRLFTEVLSLTLLSEMP